MDIFLSEWLLLNVNDSVLSADDDFRRDFIQVDHHDTVRQLRRLIHEILKECILLPRMARTDGFHH